MKIITFTLPLLIMGMAAPVGAQTLADDVQCLVLSGLFSKSASQEAAKQAAAQAMIFYIGRLDARANPQAIKSQIQALKIDPKTASAGMTACAQRVDQAGRAMLPGGPAQGARR